MKKIILCIITFMTPFLVNAASINYDVTNFFIDATVKSNGNLEIKELIVLNGNFNGYIRDLQYKNPKLENYVTGNINFSNSAIYNASGISNVKIATKKIVEEEITFETFNEVFNPLTMVASESDAVDGKYVYHRDGNILSYKMYQKADDETIAFLITYTIDKAVVMHNDIAELYWTFIGDGFDDKIYNLKIQVHLPQIDEQSTLLFWAHGDITGSITKTNSGSILAQMKSVAKNSPIDLRIVFDKSLITNQDRLRNSEMEALTKILEIEEQRAESVNRQREFIEFMVKLAKSVTIIYYLVIIITWIWVYFKFDREYKSEFKLKYYREFTGNYNVEVIDYLMNKRISSNALSASIMNLIYKKNIKFEEELGKKKKYRYTLLNNDNVTDTEQMLIDFLFEEVGKNNTFTTTDLEKYAKSSKTCENFSKRYYDWKNCVKKDAEREKFYETNGIPIVISIILVLISILIFMVVLYYQIDLLICYFSLPLSIVFLFYTFFIKKRTRKGNEDYLRWKAFKNFLQDFGNFEVKELPEIVLWEKYLVYATIFGLADAVEKSMNVKITEFQSIDGGKSLSSTWNPIYNLHLYHIINNSVNTAITNSITATTAKANSHRSSGSGFGGGFSGGAGFGGGGGGGRGF